MDCLVTWRDPHFPYREQEEQEKVLEVLKYNDINPNTCHSIIYDERIGRYRQCKHRIRRQMVCHVHASEGAYFSCPVEPCKVCGRLVSHICRSICKRCKKVIDTLPHQIVKFLYRRNVMSTDLSKLQKCLFNEINSLQSGKTGTGRADAVSRLGITIIAAAESEIRQIRLVGQEATLIEC